MNEYRKQQLAAAALIESGSYTAEQIAEIYGWTKSRTAPELIDRPKPKRKRKKRRLIHKILKILFTRLK